MPADSSRAAPLSLQVIVLAAGQGKRMNSAQPKVLQPLAGRSLLAHVLDTARALEPERIVVVYGHAGEQVRAAFAECTPAAVPLHWAYQAERRGTGHAVQQALPQCVPEGIALILYGDCPLLRVETLQALLREAGERRIVLLTAWLDDPRGYGRIVREKVNGGSANMRAQPDGMAKENAARVLRIVEERDATVAERAICEVNTGVMALPLALLRAWLPQLRADNAQGEYYLTDLIARAVAEDIAVHAVPVRDPREAMGVNDRLQLAQVERMYQQRSAEALLAAGVMLLDPARFDLRGTLRCGRDVVIDINVICEGEVELGNGVHVGAGAVLRDVRVGAGVEIKPYSVIEGSEIGAGSDVGPFARLRSGSVLGERVHIGNFVETKATRLGAGSKVGHLAYLGDADIGERVNIAAGVITCNYDGANKFRTTVGDDVFIGSDSQLVAPVTLEARAYVAAGSTITQNCPADALSICRARGQKSFPGWKRPRKESALPPPQQGNRGGKPD